MSRRGWAQDWGQLSDTDLESAARYYLWLATSFPNLQNPRLAEIVTEAGRRGKPEIVENARTSLRTGKASG